MDAGGERTAVRAVVHGRVQGVGFRAFTVRAAQALGVAGTVANQRDGTVCATLEGPRPAVDALLARLRSGPPTARVDRVEVERVRPTGATGFRATG